MNLSNSDKSNRSREGLFTASLMDSTLLVQMNKIQRELGEPERYERLPELPEGMKAAFDGQRVLMLDYSAKALAEWSPFLITATNGNFSYIHIRDHFDLELITAKTLKYRPDFILIGNDCGINGFTGVDLAVLFGAMEMQGLIIGFSISSACRDRFKEYGFTHTADKADKAIGFDDLMRAANYRRQQVKAARLGSPLFQGMAERFSQMGGMEVYHSALAEIATNQNPATLLSRGYPTSEHYKSSLNNLSDKSMHGLEESPFRRLLSVIEIDNQVVHGGSEGRKFEQCFEHPEATKYLSQIVSIVPAQYAAELDGFRLVKAASYTGNFALLFEKRDSDGHLEWKLMTANEQVSFTGMDEALLIGLGAQKQVVVIGSADEGTSVCICDGKRFIKEKCSDPKAVKAYFSTETQGYYARNMYVVEVNGQFLVNGNLYESHGMTAPITEWQQVRIETLCKTLDTDRGELKLLGRYLNEPVVSDMRIFVPLNQASIIPAQ